MEEKKKRMKLRISRIFCSSLSSCSSSRNITDVALHHPQPPPSSPHHHLFHLFSPKSIPPPPPPPSITITSQKSLPRRKVSDRNSLLFPSSSSHIITDDGRKCPPASPISPLPIANHFDCKPRRKNQTNKTTTTKKKKKKKKNPTTHLKNQTGPGLGQSQRVLLDPGSYSSHPWLTSEEEEEDNDDETTLFSSKSLSSDSSDHSSFRRNRGRRRKKTDSAVGGLEGKMEDSFPVVKRSRDPYSDFRTSMVEMIVEKQIFAARDLEKLLDCFLSLNSYKYHRVIVEVFTEICEALFSNWS